MIRPFLDADDSELLKLVELNSPNYFHPNEIIDLMDHRLSHIRSKERYRIISVRTSQHAFKFYQKCGFELQKVVKDYWAEAFDLYEMKMHL